MPNTARRTPNAERRTLIAARRLLPTTEHLPRRLPVEQRADAERRAPNAEQQSTDAIG